MSWALWARIGPITVARRGAPLPGNSEAIEPSVVDDALDDPSQWRTIAAIDAALSGSSDAMFGPAPTAAIRARTIDRVRAALVDRRLVAFAPSRRAQALPEAPAAEEAVYEGADPKSWIELELVDEQGNPVPHALYRIELPDGTVRRGNLNHLGFARISGVDPGTCKVSFPNAGRVRRAA